MVEASTPWSGRVTGIAADPGDANTLYIAAAGGGVWKTTNGGGSWRPLTDDQPTLFMGAIAVAPSNPSVIYAGTGEANNSGDSFYGRGVLKSTDGGRSWRLDPGNAFMNEFDRRTISRIVVNPTNPNDVYVAVAGPGVNGLSIPGNTGIWHSTTGGGTWVNTTTAISTTAHYSDLVMDPTTTPVTLYTAVWDEAGPASGVYQTLPGGGWSRLGGGMPAGPSVGRTALAISPNNPQILYAAITGTGQMGSSPPPHPV
jgi:hypothetical protein